MCMALSKNSRQARMAGVQLERESKQEAWGLKGGQELATQGQGKSARRFFLNMVGKH